MHISIFFIFFRASLELINFPKIISKFQVDLSHLKKRHAQGWLDEYSSDTDEIIEKIRKYRCEKRAISIGYHGNIVELWEKVAEIYKDTGERLVDIGSDQSSCHDIRGGGYMPIGLTPESAKTFIAENEDLFIERVQEILQKSDKI